MAEAIIMPKTGMAMTEGVIIEWLKKEGDEIAVGDVIAQIETDKSTMDLESDLSGTLLKLVYEAGTTVPVTVPVAWIGKKGDKIPEVEQVEEKQEEVKISVEEAKVETKPLIQSGKIASTPAAKRAASEKNIDLASVTPTGKHGEILEKDVLSSATRATPLAERIAKDRAIDLGQVSGSGYGGKIFSRDLTQRVAGEVTKIPLTNIQKITGRRMMESVLSIPMVSEDIKVDMSRLLELKEAIFNESGIKASVNDFIIKATALALREHPRMNSTFEEDHLAVQPNIDLGIAVATERGLLVPVLRSADLYPLSELVRQSRDLIVRAREGGLATEELSGSTFTISNVGMYGITSFSPIINPPEAGILGVNTIEKLPRFVDGTLCERSILTLSLTFDHRIVDGAESAQFLQSIVALLENPLRLLV